MNTKLPPLPKQLQRDESDFGLVFRKYWNKHPFEGGIELKDTRGKDYFIFSEFHPDQEAVANSATSSKGTLVRTTVGTPGAPDYTGFVNAPYWIVIKYPKEFHIISLWSFLAERDKSHRKSLTSKRAGEISVKTVKL